MDKKNDLQQQKLALLSELTNRSRYTIFLLSAGCTLSAVSTMILAVLVVYGPTTPAPQPYVAVLREGISGLVPVGAAKPFSNRDIAPEDIKYHLTEWIKRTRSVPDDKVLQSVWEVHSHAFLLKGASERKYRTWKESDRRAARRGATVDIDIISMNWVPTTKSVIARWKETVYTRQRNVSSEYLMSGTFSLEIIPLSNITLSESRREEFFLYNPLGLFISDFQWSREIE